MLFLKANLKSIDARNTYVQISTVTGLGCRECGMYGFVSAFWIMMLWRGLSRCPIGGVEGLKVPYVRVLRCLAFACIYCTLPFNV